MRRKHKMMQETLQIGKTKFGIHWTERFDASYAKWVTLMIKGVKKQTKKGPVLYPPKHMYMKRATH
jgi:hypothetical protein